MLLLYMLLLNYYVYAYLREDGSPYYIGKGKNNRAYENHRRKNKGVHTPKDKSRIIFLECALTEIGALALERRMIKWYGRKDLGTGILRNMTDGGDGVSGITMSEESNSARSTALCGIQRKPFTNEHLEKLSAAKRGKSPPNKGKKSPMKGKGTSLKGRPWSSARRIAQENKTAKSC